MQNDLASQHVALSGWLGGGNSMLLAELAVN